MHENEYEYWCAHDPHMAKLLEFVAQRGIPWTSIDTPALHRNEAKAMAHYEAISKAMGLTEAPRLITVSDAAFAKAEKGITACYYPDFNAIATKRSYWNKFAIGLPAGEFVIRHELGHAVETSNARPNRRQFLQGIIGASLYPVAVAGGATAGLEAGKRMRNEHLPDNVIDPVTILSTSLGGLSGGHAAHATKRYLTDRLGAHLVRRSELEADRNASIDQGPLPTMRSILGYAADAIHTELAAIKRGPDKETAMHTLRTRASALQQRYPVLVKDEPLRIALLERIHTSKRPDLLRQLSANPQLNGNYPSLYERITALLDDACPPPERPARGR